MIDYTGRVVTELRAAAATWPAPFTDYEVKGGEIEAEDTPTSGKAPVLILVKRQSPIRRRRIPVATFLYTITCYHPDLRQVAVIAGLVSDAFHDRGPRVATIGGGVRIGAYNSADTGGSGSVIEPDTKWPREDVIVSVVAPTIAVS